MTTMRFCDGKLIAVFLLVCYSIHIGNALDVSPSALKVELGYFSLLMFNSPDSVDCMATAAQNLSDATTLQENFAASTSCNITSDSSSGWVLVVDNDLKRVYASRVNQSIQLNQLLVVSCCDTSLSFSSSLITVDVAPDVVFNSSDPTQGTVYPNPGYVDLAPCPCNLTDGRCDINCCCDLECSPNDTLTFACITGAFGGNLVVDPNEVCSTQQFDVADWQPFLCALYVNTPDLGLFYLIDVNTANTDVVFSTRLLKNPFTYDYTNDVPGTEITTGLSYQNGDLLQIQSGSIVDYLTLPQNSLSGQCVRNSPVTFQDNSDSICSVTVTDSLCTTNSVLDLNYYLTDTSTVVAGNRNVTPTVIYKCADSADYVRTNQDSAGSTGTSLFNDGTTTASSVTCPNPGPPQLVGTECQNSVVSVTYAMTWNQSTVSSINVEVTVANVSLTELSSDLAVQPNNVLTQAFQVRFEQATTENLTYLSGNPGYDTGYPVISGVTAPDESVSTDAAEQLRIWQPGPSGLCVDSSKIAPSFGVDTLTGCQLRLSANDFDNCTDLRKEIEIQQRSLIASATWVSRFGNPDFSSTSSDWLVVNTSQLSEANNSLSTIAGECGDVPSHVSVQFLTSLTGKILGFPIMEIVGVRVNWTRETWQMKCAGSQACSTNGSSLVESFSLTSSVTFTTIPAVQESPPLLSDLLYNESCDKFATCWPELPLPLTTAFFFAMPSEVAQSEREYNTAFALLLVLFTLGVCFLPLSWNKAGRYVKMKFPL